MDANYLGTLGLTTVTFALPLLVLVADDLRKRRLRRRPVPKRVHPSGRTRSQAHPMTRINGSRGELAILTSMEKE